MRRNEPVTLLHIYWTSGLNQPFHEAVGGFMKTVNMESSKLKAKPYRYAMRILTKILRFPRCGMLQSVKYSAFERMNVRF